MNLAQGPQPAGPPVFSPTLDALVWVTVLLFLLVLGARAYVAETGYARTGRNPPAARAFTVGAVALFAALAVLLTVQGGQLLVHSVITRTDPVTGVSIDAPAPADQPAAPAAPAGGAPAAPNG